MSKWIEVDKWMVAVIGSAKKKGATEEELQTLIKAAELITKYKPRKGDAEKD